MKKTLARNLAAAILLLAVIAAAFWPLAGNDFLAVSVKKYHNQVLMQILATLEREIDRNIRELKELAQFETSSEELLREGIEEYVREMLDEEMEQGELKGGQEHRLSAFLRFVLFEIDLDIAEVIFIYSLPELIHSSKQSFHPGKKFSWTERLGDIIIGA